MKEDTIILIATFLLVVILGTSFSVFSSYQESKTFNRLCEPKIEVTTWDAMFSELRVDSCVK